MTNRDQLARIKPEDIMFFRKFKKIKSNGKAESDADVINRVLNKIRKENIKTLDNLKKEMQQSGII